MLNKGADPLIRNKEGLNAVENALKRKNRDMYNVLIQQNGLLEFIHLKRPVKPVKKTYVPLFIFVFIYLSVTLFTICFTF